MTVTVVPWLLVVTRLPLREFAKLYADVVRAAARRNPMRVHSILHRPGDMARVLWAEWHYVRAFRRLHRDFPGKLRRHAGTAA